MAFRFQRKNPRFLSGLNRVLSGASEAPSIKRIQQWFQLFHIVSESGSTQARHSREAQNHPNLANCPRKPQDLSVYPFVFKYIFLGGRLWFPIHFCR